MVRKPITLALTGLALLVSSPEIEAGKPAKTSIVAGIDVSHHQGKINWRKVHYERYTFAYIKSTQGENWQDPNYKTNLSGAERAGLKVGCYHFATPGSWPDGEPYNFNADAKLEALGFVYHSGRCLKRGNLRPALDLEDDGSGNIKKLAPQELADWVKTWMDTVEQRTGIEPLLYGYKYPLKAGKADPKIVEYDLWLADYNYSPDSAPWPKPTLWQYSRTGRVPGIKGKTSKDVDLNRFEGSLRKFNRRMLIR